MGENNNEENNVLNIKTSIIDKEDDTYIIDERGKRIGDNKEEIPDPPPFSDGSNGELDFVDDNIKNSSTDLININKQSFEKINNDINSVNDKIENLIKILDFNIKEINSAIKATQIYSKLFTKFAIGINILIVILIIVLFIIK